MIRDAALDTDWWVHEPRRAEGDTRGRQVAMQVLGIEAKYGLQQVFQKGYFGVTQRLPDRIAA